MREGSKPIPEAGIVLGGLPFGSHLNKTKFGGVNFELDAFRKAFSFELVLEQPILVSGHNWLFNLILLAAAHVMKSIRYILGVIGFIVVWFAVAAVVGLCLSFLFPPALGHDGVINWRSLPGNVLGIGLGYHLFRVIVREPQKTGAK